MASSNSHSDSIQQQIADLTAAMSQLSESVGTLVQVTATNTGKVDQLTEALSTLVSEFIRPSLLQANANREAIAALIESNQRHQEWLDEDRRDINTLRADTTSQIQGLLDSASADRKAFIERFDNMQTEIRQNQRLLLNGQKRSETLLAEVLSLSRRVQAVEDAA